MRSSFPKLWSLDILGGSTATSRLSQSGDKSPHSKTLARLRGPPDLAPVPLCAPMGSGVLEPPVPLALMQLVNSLNR